MLRCESITKVILHAGQDKYRNITAYKAKPYGGSKPVAFAEGLKSALDGV